MGHRRGYLEFVTNDSNSWPGCHKRIWMKKCRWCCNVSLFTRPTSKSGCSTETPLQRRHWRGRRERVHRFRDNNGVSNLCTCLRAAHPVGYVCGQLVNIIHWASCPALLSFGCLGYHMGAQLYQFHALLGNQANLPCQMLVSASHAALTSLFSIFHFTSLSYLEILSNR